MFKVGVGKRRRRLTGAYPLTVGSEAIVPPVPMIKTFRSLFGIMRIMVGVDMVVYEVEKCGRNVYSAM
jgi:hypothetical protein